MLQADGGTRTAAISGAYVALKMAMDRLRRQEAETKSAARTDRRRIRGYLRRHAVLDLDYAEDSEAETDMNVV